MPYDHEYTGEHAEIEEDEETARAVERVLRSGASPSDVMSELADIGLDAKGVAEWLLKLKSTYPANSRYQLSAMRIFQGFMSMQMDAEHKGMKKPDEAKQAEAQDALKGRFNGSGDQAS